MADEATNTTLAKDTSGNPVYPIAPKEVREDETRKEYSGILDKAMGSFNANLQSVGEQGKRAAMASLKDAPPIFSQEQQDVQTLRSLREGNEAADPTKAINAALSNVGAYARQAGLNERQTQALADEALRRMQERLISERIPKSAAENILFKGLQNTDLGKSLSTAIQTDYEKSLDKIAEQRRDAGFYENVAKGVITLAGDLWEYMGPQAFGGAMARKMGLRNVSKVATDLVKRGLPKAQAEKIATRLVSNSVKGKVAGAAASNAVTFAIPGAVNGANDSATGNISEVSPTDKSDLTQGIKAVSQPVTASSVLKGAAEGGLWGAATGASMAGGGILGDIISHGKGIAGRALGAAVHTGTNAAAMTAVGTAEQAVEGQEPITAEGVGKQLLTNAVTFGALDAMSGAKIAKNLRNAKAQGNFERNYDISKQDEEAYRKAGYGNLIDAVERVATGQSGIRTINKGNGETKGGGVTPTKNTPAYQEADIQDIKYGLGQLKQDIQDHKISAEQARKLYALVTGDFGKSLSPVTGFNAHEDTTPDGKTKYVIDYLDKYGGLVKSRSFRNSKEMASEAGNIKYQTRINQIDALEQAVAGKYIDSKFEQQATDEYNAIDSDNVTDHERDLIMLNGNIEIVKEAFRKEQNGEPLKPKEYKVAKAAQRVYRKYYEECDVNDAFVKKFEQDNGLPEGYMQNALEGLWFSDLG